MSFATAILVAVTLIVLGGAFLGPAVLVLWEVCWGQHQSARKRYRPIRFHISIKGLLIATAVVCLLVGAYQREAVATTLLFATAAVTGLIPALYLAWYMFDDVRGRRRASDRVLSNCDRSAKALEWLESSKSHASAQSSSRRAPASAREKKWWAKQAPATKITQFGLWR